jgi:hypothetical protein
MGVWSVLSVVCYLVLVSPPRVRDDENVSPASAGFQIQGMVPSSLIILVVSERFFGMGLWQEVGCTAD